MPRKYITKGEMQSLVGWDEYKLSREVRKFIMKNTNCDPWEASRRMYGVMKWRHPELDFGDEAFPIDPATYDLDFKAIAKAARINYKHGLDPRTKEEMNLLKLQEKKKLRIEETEAKLKLKNKYTKRKKRTVYWKVPEGVEAPADPANWEGDEADLTWVYHNRGVTPYSRSVPPSPGAVGLLQWSNSSPKATEQFYRMWGQRIMKKMKPDDPDDQAEENDLITELNAEDLIREESKKRGIELPDRAEREGSEPEIPGAAAGEGEGFEEPATGTD